MLLLFVALILKTYSFWHSQISEWLTGWLETEVWKWGARSQVSFRPDGTYMFSWDSSTITFGRYSNPIQTRLDGGRLRSPNIVWDKEVLQRQGALAGHQWLTSAGQPVNLPLRDPLISLSPLDLKIFRRTWVWEIDPCQYENLVYVF